MFRILPEGLTFKNIVHILKTQRRKREICTIYNNMYLGAEVWKIETKSEGGKKNCWNFQFTSTYYSPTSIRDGREERFKINCRRLSMQFFSPPQHHLHTVPHFLNIHLMSIHMWRVMRKIALRVKCWKESHQSITMANRLLACLLASICYFGRCNKKVCPEKKIGHRKRLIHLCYLTKSDETSAILWGQIFSWTSSCQNRGEEKASHDDSSNRIMTGAKR